MFHLVALSGARVAALVALLSVLLSLVFYPFIARGVGGASLCLRYSRSLLPTLACGTLYLTSGGAAPVRRLFPMALAFLVLRLRKWEASRIQMIASAVALAILIDPALIARPGFILSAVGTALLLQLVSGLGGRHNWKSYLFVVSVMPLVMIPLTAFFFAKVGWLGPIYCLMLNWVWDFFLIPLGFLLPLAWFVMPLSIFEWMWRVMVSAQSTLSTRIGTLYVSVIRPTLFEVALLEALLIILFIWSIAFWRKPR